MPYTRRIREYFSDERDVMGFYVANGRTRDVQGSLPYAVS
jgi:hypothetical protein